MQTKDIKKYIRNLTKPIPKDLVDKGYICPIYSIHKNGDEEEYEGVASSVIIQYMKYEYLITAAHVLQEKNLAVLIKNKLFEIPGIEFKEIYIGNENGVIDDIAIYRIKDDLIQKHNIQLNCFKAGNFNELDKNNIYYGIAIGFPANKNQIKHSRRKKGEYACCDGTIVEANNNAYDKLNGNKGDNFILYMGSYTETEQGTHGNFIKANGMSGGAMIALTSKKIENERIEINNLNLVGLLIEKHCVNNDHYFIAICFDKILGIINASRSPHGRKQA